MPLPWRVQLNLDSEMQSACARRNGPARFRRSNGKAGAMGGPTRRAARRRNNVPRWAGVTGGARRWMGVGTSGLASAESAKGAGLPLHPASRPVAAVADRYTIVDKFVSRHACRMVLHGNHPFFHVAPMTGMPSDNKVAVAEIHAVNGRFDLRCFGCGRRMTLELMTVHARHQAFHGNPRS